MQQSDQKRKLDMAWERMAHQGMLKGFETWRAQAAERMAEHKRAQMVVMHLRSAKLASAFETWRAHATCLNRDHPEDLRSRSPGVATSSHSELEMTDRSTLVRVARPLLGEYRRRHLDLASM